VIIKTGYEGRRARIVLIALIDIVFLLLVFFIYAMLSMTVQRGIDVNLPQGKGDLIENKENHISITITEENRLFFNEVEMEMERLVAEVSKQCSRDGIPVIIKGDKRADFGYAVELLSLLRDAGVTGVSFLVEELR
jgi:biopolymer transport protein ExbD